MASTNFVRGLEQVKALSADERRQLRQLLDTLLTLPDARLTEDELERALIAAGLLSVPEPQDRDVERYWRYKPVTVQGKPVSETLTVPTWLWHSPSS